MTTWRDGRSHRLTRHFFASFFDLGFLSDAGARSFTRYIIGICALFLSFGLLLTRMYIKKYAMLAEQATPEHYRQAVLADHALIMAIPMWIVAFVTVLVSHALFPDELDFRVLLTLPLSRRLVFGAKLAALTLFAGLFIGSAHAALAPLFVLTAVSHWANAGFLPQAAAFGAASILASAFAVLAVAAMQGVLLLALPPGRVLSVSAAMRSAMICGLMLSLPVVGRLPATALAFAHASTWLYFTPPAWFVGLERWLLGDPRAHIAHLALLAGASVGLAAAVASGSYALLYRRFDRLLVRPAVTPPRSNRRAPRLKPWRATSRPVFVATKAFILATLRRSVLHQGIVVALSAIGAGLIINSALAASLGDWLAQGGPASRRVVESVVWAPFPLMYIVSRAVRAALLVPIEQRANWVFRMTERPVSRAQQLGAAVAVVGVMGVVVPVGLLLPLQWLVLGADAVAVAAIASLCGWLHLEWLMKDWDRIPFTCSYIPGKGFVPQMLLIGAVSFVLFTTFGAALARGAAGAHPFAWVIAGLLVIAAVVLRRHRRTAWRDAALQFEDTLPTELNPLRLSVD